MPLSKEERDFKLWLWEHSKTRAPRKKTKQQRQQYEKSKPVNAASRAYAASSPTDGACS